MLKTIVLLIVTASSIVLMTTEAQVCPCKNTKEINPVCGSDNLTYINPGEVKCLNQCERKNLKIVDKKPCPCECPNTREFWPVCADDDNTYVNPGAVKCHNNCNYHKIKVVKQEPCRPDDVGLPY